MHIYDPQFFLYGALAFAGIMLLTHFIPATQLRLHLRALGFALTLSPVVITDGGGMVVPILSALFRSNIYITPGVMHVFIAYSFVICWGLASVFLYVLMSQRKK